MFHQNVERIEASIIDAHKQVALHTIQHAPWIYCLTPTSELHCAAMSAIYLIILVSAIK